jgi:S-sulfosulfanyl-L-cysteine sulfohydrolase
MKGKDLLNTLEGVADNLFDTDPYLQSGGDMVRVGRIDYTVDPSKKLGERITNAKLDNGEAIDPEKTYNVACWASVNHNPEGRLIWDIVHDYIQGKKGKNNVLRLPKINHPTLVGVKTNPGIENYPVILFSLNQYTTINKTSPCCVVFLLKNNKTQNYPLKEYGQ